MMKTEIRTTGDGSKTLYVPALNEHYHSTFGALTESMHVFIRSGLRNALLQFDEIHLLEIGFGTGLNALLTLLEAKDKNVFYTALEPFPVDRETVISLNYGEFFTGQEIILYEQIHDAAFGEKCRITSRFELLKLESPVQKAILPGKYNLVYFDAFGPDVQPELWTASVFEKIAGWTAKGGILTTYSAKGEVRRNLQKAGFTVERIAGPPGKRHISRAVKLPVRK
jgi:tRNA U34 5-methylaminomethyl-2-thiouridine-forming methyltransferase MnmC